MKSSHFTKPQSRHDYCYSPMSPALSTIFSYDNHSQHLFGDVVPVSDCLLQTFDNQSDDGPAMDKRRDYSMHEYNNNKLFSNELKAARTHIQHDVRRNLIDKSLVSSSDSDQLRANSDLFDSEILIPTVPKRLFSEEPVKYRDLISSKYNSDSIPEWDKPNIDYWNDIMRPRCTNIMDSYYGRTKSGSCHSTELYSSNNDKKSHKNAPTSQGLPNASDEWRELPFLPQSISLPDKVEVYSKNKEHVPTTSPKHDVSAIILTNTVKTGSEFRLRSSRSHKNMSFTILNDLESNQERPISSPGGRLSPFRGKGFRDDKHRWKSRPVSCPESPRNNIYPRIRRPSVHFDKIPTDTDSSSPDRTHDVGVDGKRHEHSPSRYSIRHESAKSPKIQPTARQSFQRSLSSSQITFDHKKAINNPRSYHRGLLSVISTTNTALPPKMPLRRLSISNPNLSDMNRQKIVGNFQVLDRRDSSSPDLPANFGSLVNEYGTPKMTRTMSRISRPTNLSPIVGTPDRDSCNDSNTPNNSISGTVSPAIKHRSIEFTRRRSTEKPSGRSTTRRNGSVSSNSTPSPKKSPQKSARGSTSDLKISLTADSNNHGTTKKKSPTANLEKKTNKKSSPTKSKRTPTSSNKQTSKQNADNSEPDKTKSDTKPAKAATKPNQNAKLLKNQSDPSLAKLLNKRNSFKKRRTSSESDGFPGAAQLLETIKTPQVIQDKVENASSDKMPADGNKTKTNNTDNKTDHNGDKLIGTENKKVISDNSNNIVENSQQIKIDDSGAEHKSAIDIGDSTAGGKVESATKVESNEKPMAATPDMEIDKDRKADAKSTKKISEKSLMVGGETIPATPTETSRKDIDLIDNASIVSPSDTHDSVALDSSEKTLDKLDIADITSIPTEASVIDMSIDNQEKFPEMLLKASDDHLNDRNMINHTNQGLHDADNIDSHADNLLKDQMSENGDENDRGCCKFSKCCTPFCTSTFCWPCRRLRNASCCKRNKDVDEQQKEAVVATAVDELDEQKSKISCWRCFKCGKTKKKDMMEIMKNEAVDESSIMGSTTTPKSGGCKRCLLRVFCCRSVNRVQSGDMNELERELEDESRNCCLRLFCCCCKRKAPAIHDELPPPPPPPARLDQEQTLNCCSRMFSKMMCCKPKPVPESRRTSMNSKKQSVTIPPEEIRPKIDESLVDNVSIMKGAIPVLPIGLAWFCLICNCVIPGLGTILSGIFCLCFGIPRFTQHDGAKARIGSLFVNTIVGLAQAFTLIFCFVGYGWSVWWGIIMLQSARRHRQILDAENDLGDIHNATNPPTANHRDVEFGRDNN